MQIKIKDLLHHPLNSDIYNLSNLDDLTASINEVGLLTPLVIDERNQVISGNRRLKCIQILGWKTVEVNQIHIGDQNPALLIIHHNKQRQKSYQELINEYLQLSNVYKLGRGKRSDLTYGRSTVSADIRQKTTRDLIAEQLNLSSSQLYKPAYIHKQNSQLIKKLDDGDLTINKAYDTLKSGMRWRLGGPRESVLDFYETPKIITEQLLANEPFDFSNTALEPADGKGAISSVLEQYFLSVVSYDIERDFLQETQQYDILITNPPYSKSIDFIQKAMHVVRDKFCFLLPIGYLNGKQRYGPAFGSKAFPLKRVLVFVPNLHLGHPKSSAENLVEGGLLGYAWFIWQRGYEGDPTISWIEKPKKKE